MGLGTGLALLMVLGVARGQSPAYVGKPLGALSELHHGVRGRVFAVDSRTLYLQDFQYDGEGPAAYFYVGTSGRPSATGALRLRDERGGTGPLRRYRGEGVTLALPDGKTLRDLRWFAVWCDEYSVNFGDVVIPRDLDYPKPAKVGSLRGVHGVSSDPIVVVDAQTLLVPNFSYDGEAPDAKFWVGRGEKPSPQGIRIPDENGKETPLRKYDKKTIVLTLPGELTVFDIGYFSVWCEAFTVNFGHVVLPHSQLANVPPSLKMLGVSPQSKLNCEVLLDELAFEVRWAVAGDSIVLQLVAKLEDGEYMSFGISGDGQHSQMVGGDVVVAWVDKQSLKGYAHDYYLDAKSQCAGVRGSCPDERLGEKTNSVRLLNAALVNGYSIVTYQRSLKAADELDRAIFTNASQPVIWALGPLNSRAEVSYHHHFTKGDRFIEFGRPPLWNCPMPDNEEDSSPPPPAIAESTYAPIKVESSSQLQESNPNPIKPKPVPTPKPVPKATPWEIPGIQCYEPPDGVFYAQMGPTGGKQGYSAITGHVGWGISWYINGLLIPEITVVRGRRYTFVVEGGDDPDTPATYHPFYITNDPVGGYYHKSPEEKKGVEIYAGVRRSRSGELIPTGVGRSCIWTPDTNGAEADEYPSFGAYQRSLTLVCENGNPGVVSWTPDKNTPDTVYYQCFTHRYLGWKIHVVDACDEEPAESRVQETVVLPPADLQQQESVQVASRVRPDGPNVGLNSLTRTKLEKIMHTKHHDFSSDRTTEEVVSAGQIHDVIRAVESLESRMRGGEGNRTLHQYQVHEQPERAAGEGDEYVVQADRPHDAYFLPPSGRPLTLQSVLRPGPRPGPRPPYRRPVPPEISLRRPQPPPPAGFPLPMPTHHIPHYKKPYKPYDKPSYDKPPYDKPSFDRMPPMNRPRIPPMKPMPLPPTKHRQPIKKQNVPIQGIIFGKPQAIGPGPMKMALPPQTHTLSLGRTELVADKVVKSQITLPSDSTSASSIQNTFVNRQPPGQIILGKPMDHPVPLDQQMTPTEHLVITAPPTPPPEPNTTPRTTSPTKKSAKRPAPPPPQQEMESSDFLGESPDPSTLQPAVNTGFKPNTIVIESGFKPIIREPLMDRVGGDYDISQEANRREDTDVEEDYNESPQPIANHAYDKPSEQMTQSFEPMFIPSPPDLLLPTNDRTKEVFPSNHAKEDRPHPVYVKTESELNALFSKKNMEKEVPSDMVMESDRISPQYLPPDPKLPKEHSQKLAATNEETFTTYDGKTVSAATLTMLPDAKPGNKLFSSKLPANSELLLRTPQFGPFKGEIPPAVAGSITTVANKEDDIKVTHLKLVNSAMNDEKSDIVADGSENHEKVVKPEEDSDNNKEEKKEVTTEEMYDPEASDEEEEEEEEDDEDLDVKRRKREVKYLESGKTEKREKRGTNQIDFQSQTASSASVLHWTHLGLLPLLLQFF